MTTRPALGKHDLPRGEAQPSQAPGMKATIGDDHGPSAYSHPRDKRAPWKSERWSLYLQARSWRFLMAIGMAMHRAAPPRPPKPAFSRVIPVTVSSEQGTVSILFYVPTDYERRKAEGGPLFPVVLNFHGGGFTLGNALDDARWAHALVDQVGAVVACVEYRRAPEHPFPTAVEDGVDALIYISRHSRELHVDHTRIIVSGFSSGGNMAFAVPLRLHEELNIDQVLAEDTNRLASDAQASAEVDYSTPAKAPLVEVTGADSDADPATAARQVADMLGQTRILAICAWYPPTDYTRSRDERTSTARRSDKTLPAFFYKLFDASYLKPPTVSMTNPHISPGVASDNLLDALPPHVLLQTCEWDMLLDEGQKLRDRLDKLGKGVHYTMIEHATHGWDRAPNPLRVSRSLNKHYRECCGLLRRLLDEDAASSASPSPARVGESTGHHDAQPTRHDSR